MSNVVAKGNFIAMKLVLSKGQSMDGHRKVVEVLVETEEKDSESAINRGGWVREKQGGEPAVEKRGWRRKREKLSDLRRKVAINSVLCNKGVYNCPSLLSSIHSNPSFTKDFIQLSTASFLPLSSKLLVTK